MRTITTWKNHEKKSRVAPVHLMSALQWLERTSGIFNYAALATACQYQRAFAVFQGQTRCSCFHVTFDPPTILFACMDSSMTRRLNKDRPQMHMYIWVKPTDKHSVLKGTHRSTLHSLFQKAESPDWSDNKQASNWGFQSTRSAIAHLESNFYSSPNHRNVLFA